MRLDAYERTLDRGRALPVEVLWIAISTLLVRGPIPGSALRRWVLKAFGAMVGRNVVIKPGVRVKFPWKLEIGDFTWVGEDVWLDNVDWIRIGANVCISQGAYLGSGNHDWAHEHFALRAAPIQIGEGSWICAKAIV